MRVIRYLKHSKAAVALIVALLIVQAFADLSLPRYTSDIVDVGISQGGIEHASPDAMRASTFEAACVLASKDGESLIRSSYASGGDGVYELSDAAKSQRDELDAELAWPLAVVHFAQSVQSETAPAEGTGLAAGTFDVDQLVAAYEQGAVSKDEVLDAAEAAKEKLGLDEALIEQQAIAAVKAENEALGKDAAAIQMGYLARVGLRMLGVAALMAGASIAVGFVASRTAAKIARDLRERLFAKVVSFSDAEVQRFSAASLITRGTNDIQQIQMVATMLLRMVLYAPILAVGGIVMIVQTNLAMGWIVVVAIVALFALIGILMAVAMPKFKMMQKLIDRVNLVAREMLTGLPVIRAFGRQETEAARFDAASKDLYRTQLFTNRAMTFMMPAMMLVMNAVSVAIVWVGGSYIDSGIIQTGDMIAFITYAMVIIMSFLVMSMVSIMLPRAEVAAERIDEVLAARCSVADPDPASAQTLPQTGRRGARIEFRDATFSYEKGSEPALSHVDFTIEPGMTCAIVGPTGSGKTTLLKLIERFYDVDSGAVLIDGVDVRSISQHELRRQLGYVPQAAFLFSGTVESAIGYGVDGPDAAKVRRAAAIAQADGFIEAREGGYDSAIAQGGSNVSGGQRQRLSIARAIAADARAYLFDDSFSALDYATDARLREALARELGDVTKVIVAQRISTVAHADLIVVLDDGRVAGCGTHAELLESCPEYREIAASQLSEEDLARALAGAHAERSVG